MLSLLQNGKSMRGGCTEEEPKDNDSLFKEITRKSCLQIVVHFLIKAVFLHAVLIKPSFKEK